MASVLSPPTPGGALLVRHTRVAAPSGVCYGRSDVQLALSWAGDFAETLSALLAACAEREVAPRTLRLVTSPLGRCRRLAEYLARKLGCPRPTADPRLTEYDFGAWELRPWDDFHDTPAAHAWFADPTGAACPGGESYPELRDRVLAAWTDWRERVAAHDGETLCVVGHAGPLRVLLSALHGVAPLESLSLPFAYGEVRWIEPV